MEKKSTIFPQKILIVLIVFYFGIFSELSAVEDSSENMDYSDTSFQVNEVKSKPPVNSILNSYSYYRGVELDFIINPGVRLSYLNAIYYNTFIDFGLFIPLSWSTKSSVNLLTGVRFAFNMEGAYTLQLGSSLSLKYQRHDDASQIGLYLLPRLINLFDITDSLIISLEFFTNINLYRSSKKISTSIRPYLGIGFIYKL